MKIRRRAHPINPAVGTTRPRQGSVATKRLPTRNRMGAGADWPLYNSAGELIDRAAIQAKVVEQTNLRRVGEGSSSPVESLPESPAVRVPPTGLEPLQSALKPVPVSALGYFKAKYHKAAWYIHAKGSNNGHDSIYLTADNSAELSAVPTTFEGVQVRITYVKRGRR